MRYILLISLMCAMTSCAAMPQIAQSIEDIADNDSLHVTLSKDAFHEKSSVKVNVEISK